MCWRARVRIDHSTKAGSLRLATTTTRMQLWAHFTLPASHSRDIATPILDLLHSALALSPPAIHLSLFADGSLCVAAIAAAAAAAAACQPPDFPTPGRLLPASPRLFHDTALLGALSLINQASAALPIRAIA